MTFDLFYAVLIVIVDDLWLIPRQMTPPQKDVPQYPAHAYGLANTSKQRENRPPTTERMLTPDFIMVTVKTFKDLQSQNYGTPERHLMDDKRHGPLVGRQGNYKTYSGQTLHLQRDLGKERRYIPRYKDPRLQGLCVEARRHGVFPQ